MAWIPGTGSHQLHCAAAMEKKAELGRKGEASRGKEGARYATETHKEETVPKKSLRGKGMNAALRLGGRGT